MLRVTLTLLLLTAASAANADPLGVLHAGRWEMTMGDPGTPNARVMYTCRQADRVMDENAIKDSMGQMAASCSKVDFVRNGSVVTYTLLCKYKEMTVSTVGKTTLEGPDSFTTVSHTHIEGSPQRMPDQDMNMHIRRVGSTCQPTDRITK